MLHLPKIKSRLTATVSRVRACLDFPSLLAIDYAKAALSKGGAADVPSSLVIRLALAQYARHLSDPATSLDVEAHLAHQASVFRHMPDEARQKALQRLKEATEGEHLQPFADVLCWPGFTAAIAAAHAEATKDPYTA